MTKRRKKTTIYASLCCSLVLLSSLAIMSDGFTNFSFTETENSSLEVSELKNIRFLSVTDTYNGDIYTKTITFELIPSDATSDMFTSSIRWNNDDNPDYESADWREGKNIEDYLKYEIDMEKKTITINCLRAFGNQAILRLSSVENASVFAELSIDYRRKLISNTHIDINEPYYVDNMPIIVSAVGDTYSIGTIGPRSEGELELDLFRKGYQQGKVSIDDLFGDIITTGIYSSVYRYQNEKYYSAESVRREISLNVTTYINSIPTTDGSVLFSADKFKSLFTYEFVAYHTTEDIYQSTSDLYYTFLDRYEEALTQESGFYIEAKCQDITSKTFLSFKLDATEGLIDINLGEDAIEF